MSLAAHDLRVATSLLPDPIRRAMWLALRSGWYRIEAGFWETDDGLCPLAAAARVAGVWRNGVFAGHGPEWGDEHEPSVEAWDFAISFDVCAWELGTAAAVELVLSELEARMCPAPFAAAIAA